MKKRKRPEEEESIELQSLIPPGDLEHIAGGKRIVFGERHRPSDDRDRDSQTKYWRNTMPDDSRTLEKAFARALQDDNVRAQIDDAIVSTGGLSDDQLASVVGGVSTSSGPLSATASTLGPNPSQDEIEAAASKLADSFGSSLSDDAISKIFGLTSGS
jgi:hypothetical protein